jgi:SAM-dependent methyltransferase
VLCLGARLGGEVRAFRSLGALAIGIDLNPGPINAVVLPGDFHHLPFAASTFDLIFTNVIGHAFDLARLEHEICRVLKPRGGFLMDARGDKAAKAEAMQRAQYKRPESQRLFYTDSAGLVEALGVVHTQTLEADLWLCSCKSRTEEIKP